MVTFTNSFFLGFFFVFFPPVIYKIMSVILFGRDIVCLFVLFLLLLMLFSKKMCAFQRFRVNDAILNTYSIADCLISLLYLVIVRHFIFTVT